jgi:hypothetical protein
MNVVRCRWPMAGLFAVLCCGGVEAQSQGGKLAPGGKNPGAVTDSSPELPLEGESVPGGGDFPFDAGGSPGIDFALPNDGIPGTELLPDLEGFPLEEESLPDLQPARSKWVFAYWEADGYWYPAVELADDDGNPATSRVRFTDGTEKTLAVGLTGGRRLKPGDLVEVDWQGRGKYYPGRVIATRGPQIRVRYPDDDSTEETTFHRTRIVPNGFSGLSVGQPVFARWAPDGWWYPGFIDQIDGERYHVAFSDGDSAWVTGQEITNSTVFDGHAVAVKWQSNGKYYPAVIQRRQGNSVSVIYDDGTVEHTLLKYVRTRSAPE